KPDTFARRVGPLAKRVTERLKRDAFPFIGVGPRDDLCGIVYAWTIGTVIEYKYDVDPRGGRFIAQIAGEERIWYARNVRTALGFLSRRSIALAKRVVAGQAAGLLSAPTHAGGWIAPQTLAERVNGWSGAEPEPTDACLAMLRLAPEDRAEALTMLKEVRAEWAHTIRYALGAPRVTLGNTAALWIAAARARAPWADDERIEKAFPDYGPDAGRRATYAVSVNKAFNFMKLAVQSDPPLPVSVDRDCVTVALHAQRGTGRDLLEVGGAGGRTVGAVRWMATIWPQARESLF